ncbi:MAG: EAL domain-containing protein [Deinococcota bacterium]
MSLKLPTLHRTLIVTVLFIVSVNLGGHIALPLAVDPLVSLWAPVSMLVLTLLVTQGLGYWWLVWLAPFASQLINAGLGVPDIELFPVSLLVYASSKLIVYGSIALLLKHLKFDPRLYRLEDVAMFMIFGALVGPALDGFITIPIYTNMGFLPTEQVLFYLIAYIVGDATGIASIAPLFMVFARQFPQFYAVDLPEDWITTVDSHKPISIIDVLQVLAIIGSALIVVAGFRGPMGLDYNYILFLPLLWAAARNGFARCAFAVLIVNALVLVLANGYLSADDIIPLQTGLLSATHAGILLGALFSERRAIREKLTEYAFEDPLTELPNRLALQRKLEESLPDCGALVFFDLDNFRLINRDFGQAAGDAILQRVARVLRKEQTGQTQASQIMAARTASDEFALVMNATDEAQIHGTIARVIERIRASSRTVLHDSSPERKPHLPDISVSAGLAMLEPSMTSSDALRSADVALRHAKQHALGQLVVFDNVLRDRFAEQSLLKRDIWSHLEQGYLEVYYQPLVAAKSKQLVELEALLRWHHPSLGPLAPDRFLAVLEEAGIMPQVTNWVLKQVLQQQRFWDAEGHQVDVAINLSAADLHQLSLPKRIKTLLSDADMPAQRLVVEVTENLVADAVNHANDVLQTLSELGIRIAMDDFGAGTTSLAYLKHLPVVQFKIDRSFIQDLPANQDDASLCATMINMAHNLGMTVIAEGVETRAQAAFLVEHGCDVLQGYYVGKPAPASKVFEYLPKVASDPLSR